MSREEREGFPEQIKKPYRTPDLHVYGDIRVITRVGGRFGNNDNGQGQGNDRTHAG
jgi:hypothetical protein